MLVVQKPVFPFKGWDSQPRFRLMFAQTALLSHPGQATGQIFPQSCEAVVVSVTWNTHSFICQCQCARWGRRYCKTGRELAHQCRAPITKLDSSRRPVYHLEDAESCAEFQFGREHSAGRLNTFSYANLSPYCHFLYT